MNMALKWTFTGENLGTDMHTNERDRTRKNQFSKWNYTLKITCLLRFVKHNDNFWWHLVSHFVNLNLLTSFQQHDLDYWVLSRDVNILANCMNSQKSQICIDFSIASHTWVRKQRKGKCVTQQRQHPLVTNGRDQELRNGRFCRFIKPLALAGTGSVVGPTFTCSPLLPRN